LTLSRIVRSVFVCSTSFLWSQLCRKMTAEDFVPILCLGKGSFGTVLLVRHVVTVQRLWLHCVGTNKVLIQRDFIAGQNLSLVAVGVDVHPLDRPLRLMALAHWHRRPQVMGSVR
jgi:hypothetical protein